MQEGVRRTYRVSGMTCATCARMLQRSLSRVEGVIFASVDLATETALVISSDDVPEGVLLKAAESAGYPMVPFDQAPDVEEGRYRRVIRDLAASLGLSLPVWINMVHHMVLHGGGLIPRWLEVVLGFGAVFLGGRGIFRGAYIAVSHLHANMDVLIGLGAAAGWITGLVNLLAPEVPSFLPVGTMMVALHLLGRFIESHLRDRASKKVKGLLNLKARTARVVRDGVEEILPEEMLREGDLVRLLPGERVPADGVVLEGESALDESFITGESKAVHKRPGDQLTSGSVNLNGVLLMEAQRVGDDSFVSQMVRMVRESQGARTPIQALADRVTMYFVPGVLLLALVSALAWHLGFPIMDGLRTRVAGLVGLGGGQVPWPWLYAAMATLVIACPCALGLATPMALAVATGEASSLGVLIRDGEAFQELGKVDVVVFDKTGTVTHGRPRVVDHSLPPWALSAVLSLEARSSHPIAKGVCAFLTDLGVQQVPVEDQAEEPGRGVVGTVDGVRWFVGRPDGDRWDSWSREGLTVVEVRRDREVVGALALRDPLREDAKRVIEELVSRGIRPMMATGDSQEVASRVAAELGLQDWSFRMRPQDKLQLVNRLQSQGMRVAMVGDGINDAASLKGANVGIAMGSGLDLAIESADLVLVRGGLYGVVGAVDVSRSLTRIIAQNLAGAFIYNVLFIPMAMVGLMHPMLAELAMLCSSITVIINSLRIRARR
ncbi:heavy metal translocating P-type ATPase [Thermanaerovibrio acidaminovorans DSM 6589]|uniref:Heavy metal translocating P-type ATPase n=1 Tax=Thermanaerovibrio acidaminovorans (strain ATCC 49978 / DSM 6589 / Su883) TaxID=525903 RepID=D1B993_THEAS|nr:heavy metal translocating P-type ATPase [Thermanaerovibrio acidaminovorans]ACZ18846.1 heavy metal translocating P-type ATPase [Thermanaerovibrio acidaminovorans DSM 6589]